MGTRERTTSGAVPPLRRQLPVLALTLAIGACGGQSERAAPHAGGAASGGGGGSGAAGGGGMGGGAGAPHVGCVVESRGSLPKATASMHTDSPAVIATESGFVIGYRSQGDLGGEPHRVHLLALSDDGLTGAPEELDLGGCAYAQSNGLGLAYRAGQGMAVTGLPICASGAGMTFLPFDSDAKLGPAGVANDATSFGFGTSRRSLAPGKAIGEWELVYTQAAVPERAVLAGSALKGSVPVEHPFGESQWRGAGVATSNEVIGMLSAEDTQTSAPGHLVLLMGPLLGDNLDLAVAPLPALPLAYDGDLIAWGTRVAVGARTPSGVFVRIFELGDGGIEDVASTELPDAEAYSLSLAVDGDDLYVAHGRDSALGFVRIPGASAAPRFDQATSAVFETVIEGTDFGFDGYGYGVAAARGRVAFAWLIGSLDHKDVAGGWLIAHCE
ncbi:MAG: hypothetical protein AMXMBFR56_20890 [Polyangiaceae bacterium]